MILCPGNTWAIRINLPNLFFCSLRASCPGALWRQGGKRKESLQPRLWNLQPRSQSSSAISDVTSLVKLVGKIRRGRPRAIGLGSKPPLVTRIARTGLGTRLWNLNFASNSPVAPRRLSCQISANQREAETSANVDKH